MAYTVHSGLESPKMHSLVPKSHASSQDPAQQGQGMANFIAHKTELLMRVWSFLHQYGSCVSRLGGRGLSLMKLS